MSGQGSRKVSVRVRHSLLSSMKDVWKPLYGGKGRSRWVDEAIRDYLTNPDYFYHKANFLDATDTYAFQFILDIKDQGSLSKTDEAIDFEIGEIVAPKGEWNDPISNEKFTLTAKTFLLLEDASNSISLIRSRVKIPDPKGCIIRAAIEYALVNDSSATQQKLSV